MMIIWILSWLATVLTIGFFLSGTVTCKSILDKKKTGTVQFLPFLTTLMSCSLWTAYGLLKGDATIIRVNIVGGLLQVLYMSCFLYYSVNKKTEFRQIGYVAVAGLVVYLYMVKMLADDSERTSQLGRLCTVVTIVMMGSPLATMAEVIKTKSTETMPFVFSFLITIQSLVWLCYGIAVHDLNVQLPNGTGVLLGMIQLVLFCIYPSTPSSQRHAVDMA